MFLRKLSRFVPRSTLRRALGAFHRGDFDRATELFEMLLRSSAKPPADIVALACEAYLEAARRRASRGDLQNALHAFERASSLRPGYADVQHQLGHLYERLDQPQRAHAAYLRAIEINPKYFEARLSLARFLMHLEEPAAALGQLHEAARTGPDQAATELRDFIETIENLGPLRVPQHLEKLLDRLLNEGETPLGEALSTARRALRDGENAVAISELKALLKTHAGFPDLHNLLGVAYENEEMTDDAIEEFEQALRLNPDFLDARLNLGLALFERGRDSEAREHLHFVQDREPANQLTSSVLAAIRQRSTMP